MIFAFPLVIRAGALLLRAALGKKLISLITSGASLRAIGGALLKRISLLLAVQWTFSTLWGFFVSQATFIWNFNWAATDEQLLQQIQSRQTALASQLGGTLGNIIGWVACGALPGSLLMVHNPALGAYVLREVGREAAEEIASNLSALVRSTLVSVGQQLMISSYINVRRWLFSPGGEFVGKIFLGEEYDQAKQNYLNKNATPWSFALEVEERIDNISNPMLRAFVEELLEEAWESCVEAGFVVANSIDGWMASQKLAKKNLLGRQRVVEITPNRQVPEEKIVLAGSEQLLKPAIVQAITTHQVLENRDVGTIVAQPKTEYMLANPAIGLKLVIQMYSLQRPPYGNAETKTQITIPDVKRSALDWERIKQAVGGANGYTWGRYRGRAALDNGRSIELYASSEQEAKERLRALLPLTAANLVSMTVTEELKEGERLIHQELQKEVTRVYPGHLTIFNRVETLQTGRRGVRAKRKYEERKRRIDLWTTTKPDDFEELIGELLTRGG